MCLYLYAVPPISSSASTSTFTVPVYLPSLFIIVVLFSVSTATGPAGNIKVRFVPNSADAFLLSVVTVCTVCFNVGLPFSMINSAFFSSPDTQPSAIAAFTSA